MNRPIIRLYAFVLVLFAVLVGSTSWWTVFGAEGLRDNELNRRQLLEEAKIRRGLIRAADGSIIARSVEQRGGVFVRRYPQGSLFGHPIGYAFTELGRSQLERFRNDALTGEDDDIGSILDQLRGRRREGDNVITTLDPRAQRVALEALGGRKGAVVAIDPQSGAIKAMVSVPAYDPNQVPDRLPELNRDEQNAPLVDRATQSGYPPGSTFKVVTATAAIDSGRYTPQSTVDGSSPKDISGVPLTNFGGQDFGPVDLTTALTNSVNTVWAQVAVDLGKGTMARYMERFGFSQRPPIDLPGNTLFTSGIYDRNGELLDPDDDAVDIGRVAIGQERLLVSPLQMAMVAGAIANNGELPRPRLTERIVDRDGRTTEDIEPENVTRVMKRSTAEALQQMMGNVVREGTGTAAALSGIEVAGKTGTAERNIEQNINQPWFIGFAPIDNPQIAIAVTIERDIGGQGGTVAAPVAKQVLQSLLGG